MRVEGTFASRRHAEVWLENGGWWVADAGSTNGVRIEPAGPLQRGASRAGDGGRDAGAARRTGCASSSRRAPRGRPSEYPWLALRPSQGSPSMVTPIATASGTLRTPRTAILAARVAPDLATPTTQILPAARDESAIPPDALARRRRAHPAADAGRAAGERRPLAPPDAGRRPRPRRRLGASPRHRRDRSGGRLRRRRPRRQRRDDRWRGACRRRSRALAAGAEAGARRRLAGGGALRARRWRWPETASTEMSLPFSPHSLVTPIEPASARLARAQRRPAAVGARDQLQHRLRPDRRRGRVVVRQPAPSQRGRAQPARPSDAAVRRRRRRRRRGDGRDREPRARRPPALAPSTAPGPMRPACAGRCSAPTGRSPAASPG